MKRFNVLYTTRECPHCIEMKPQVIEINKILKKVKSDMAIEIRNLKDLDHYKLKIDKTAVQIGIGNTPHLIISKIVGGRIVEDINIKGSYLPECFKPIIFGYLNDELGEYKDIYEEEIDDE